MNDFLTFDYGDTELTERQYFDCLIAEQTEEAKNEFNADVAQRLSAPVLKTGVEKSTGGSNPSVRAKGE